MAKRSKESQERVDALAKLRDSHGKNSREGIRAQNQINKELGVSKRRDWSNVPTSSQMKIASSGANQIKAETKLGKTKTIIGKAVAQFMVSPTDKELKKTLSSFNKNKTKMAGD